jgi:hypothetical protein
VSDDHDPILVIADLVQIWQIFFCLLKALFTLFQF